MGLPDFKLETFFAKYEFRAPYLLSASDIDSMTIPEVLEMADAECLELWDTKPLGYTEVPGLPLLRQEIAKMYDSVASEGIATFAGAQEALFTAFQVLLKPEDHVVIPQICYQSFKTVPESLGARVSSYSFSFTEGAWAIDLEELEALITPETKLVVINFPHNPTGLQIDQASLLRIVAMCHRVGAYLVSDEVYRLSEHDVSDRLPAAADLYERAISVGVMSKSLGFAGLRVGWVATKDQRVLKKMLDYKCYLSICNSSPSEVLSLICLRAQEHILQKNLTVLHHNLKILQDFFSRHDDLFSWKLPIAGTSLFPKLLLPVSIDTFVHDLIQAQGVLLLPASLFDVPENHFRMGFGRKNMEEALAKFEGYLVSYEQKTQL